MTTVQRFRVWLGRVLFGRRVRRFLFWLLRNFRPVHRFGDKVFVTRFADVQEVLRRHADFSVRKFGVRMRETGGDFFLGRDDGREYHDPRVAAEAAINASEPGRVYEIALRAAAEVVEQRAKAGDHLDVVEDLAEVIPVRVAGEYFGLTNPGERTLLKWVQLMSWYIFNPYPSADDRAKAIEAGAELRDHVHRLVERRRTLRMPSSSVLDCLLRTRLAPTSIETILIGLVAGTLGPPPRLFANMVDRLLSLGPLRRRWLQRAAVEGNRKQVKAYLLEAGRFGPDPSLISRTCEKDGIFVPHARWRGEPIEAGRTVLCWIESALMDGRAIPFPRVFWPGRSELHQMLFGYGRHFCLGRDIGLGMLTGMAVPLFGLEGLRRARGRHGRLHNGEIGKLPDQNYPRHLFVRFKQKL
jgi:cytochrome P450